MSSDTCRSRSVARSCVLNSSPRYERGGRLSTTNQADIQWGAVFEGEVLVAAMLDRLLHHSHTLLIQGGSYRLK